MHCTCGQPLDPDGECYPCLEIAMLERLRRTQAECNRLAQDMDAAMGAVREGFGLADPAI